MRVKRNLEMRPGGRSTFKAGGRARRRVGRSDRFENEFLKRERAVSKSIYQNTDPIVHLRDNKYRMLFLKRSGLGSSSGGRSTFKAGKLRVRRRVLSRDSSLDLFFPLHLVDIIQVSHLGEVAGSKTSPGGRSTFKAEGTDDRHRFL